MKKTKRLAAAFAFFLLLSVLFSCAKKPVDDAENTDNTAKITTEDGFVLQEDGESLTLTGYTGKETVLHLPEEVNGLPVTALTSTAFYGNKTVEEIHLPKTVKTLPPFALAACPKLKILTVDAQNPSFRSEGNCILSGNILRFGCTGSVIPAGTEEIGDYAFYGCDGLTEIALPSSVRKIGAFAFAFCDAMESVRLEEGLTAIGESAFYYCTALTSLSLPSTLATCETGAFAATTSLASLSVAPGGAFISAGNCLIKAEDGLLIAGCRESVIPADGSVKEIGVEAFYGCIYLENITIPASVRAIHKDAFSACYKLKTAFFALDGWEVSGDGGPFGNPVEVKSVIPETGHPMTSDEVVKGNALLLCEKYNKLEWRNPNADH